MINRRLAVRCVIDVIAYWCMFVGLMYLIFFTL